MTPFIFLTRIKKKKKKEKKLLESNDMLPYIHGKQHLHVPNIIFN